MRGEMKKFELLPPLARSRELLEMAHRVGVDLDKRREENLEDWARLLADDLSRLDD